MSRIKGRVGKWELEWLSVPRGASGSAQVLVREVAAGAAAGGQATLVALSWRRDADGIWLELPGSVRGYDLAGTPAEDGTLVFRVTERGTDFQWAGATFLRSGQERVAEASSGKKKSLRVRAQMPGKIVRVLVAEGATVGRDQPLLVMEAMKMENEIRSPGEGVVRSLGVTQGQAVESGAELLVIAD
jgi:acetyl/propionyl-CoA carboxylase alpha subunit